MKKTYWFKTVNGTEGQVKSELGAAAVRQVLASKMGLRTCDVEVKKVEEIAQ